MKNYSKKYSSILIFFFLLLTSFFVIGRNLDKPFIGIHDWNGARYGNIARNYIRYGFFTTKFSQIENSGGVEKKDFKFLTHYPTLLPILISVSYRIFGISEWATRLIPLLASSGTIVITYLISRTIFDTKTGLLASLLAFSTPMVRYFGKNPVHEPIALFFASLAFLGVARLLKKEKNSWGLIYVGVTLSLLTTWSGVFLLLAISVVLFKKVNRQKIFKLWSLAFFIITFHFIKVYFDTGSFFGGGILDALLQRTNLGRTASLTQFTLFEFIDRVRLWSSNLFTLSLTIASLAGLYFILKLQTSSLKRFMSGVLIYSLGYPLAFPNATFIHEYFIFYFLLPLSLLSAFAISGIFKNKFAWFTASALLILMVWFERGDYLKALEESSGDRLAVQIGKDLNQKILEDDTVLITPYAYAASRLPHLSFYSDRKITLESNSSYNWIAEVEEKSGSYKVLPTQK